jgi:hypothetical protein
MTAMSNDIRVGDNVLFFPKSYFTGGKVTGLTNAEVCAVCTKDYVFVLPKKEFTHFLVAARTRTFEFFGEGVPVAEGVQNLLDAPDMTVSTLESFLVEMLGADKHDRVLKISELKSFKTIVFGPLSQARMKHSAGGGVKVLSCKGKGAMKQFKAFYA